MIRAEDLQQYYPFNKIDLKFYPLLLKELEFFDKQKGEKLYAINRRAENTKYLTKGVVKVVTDKGREKVIKSTSLQSKYPIGDANKSNTMDAIVDSVKFAQKLTGRELAGHVLKARTVFEFSNFPEPLKLN